VVPSSDVAVDVTVSMMIAPLGCDVACVAERPPWL
jgi:hypothetical protein